MDKAVVTAVYGPYWKILAVSWLASLREFGKYDGPVIIFVDRPIWSQEACKQLNVTLVPKDLSSNPRSNILRGISSLPIGIYSFWDADVYFASPIGEIFDIATNSFCVTNKSGFMAGGPNQWGHIRNFIHAADNLVGERNLSEIYKYLPNKTLTDDWNCSPGTHSCPKVVHISGQFKTVNNCQFASIHGPIQKKYDFFLSKGKWPQTFRFARPIL